VVGEAHLGELLGDLVVLVAAALCEIRVAVDDAAEV
jgi:hypothetical protein